MKCFTARMHCALHSGMNTWDTLGQRSLVPCLHQRFSQWSQSVHKVVTRSYRAELAADVSMTKSEESRPITANYNDVHVV